jgi:SAM-dependent methyltransferase
MGFPTGDIKLRFCSDCGFIFNALYDPSLVEYSPRCEETQGYSENFRKWHETLAKRLIQRHDLHHKEIIEIGCGKGEFLTLLCALGDNHGIGFDPAYVRERSLGARIANVDFIPRNYASEYVTRRADFLCCKMTLEHIPNAWEFIEYLRRSLEHVPDTIIFFQVPNAWKILGDLAFWDVYYEHCSYYTLGSLVRLFAGHGFDVFDVGFEYSDQYVTIEAHPGTGKTLCAAKQIEDSGAVEDAVLRFSEQLPELLDLWRKRFKHYKERNQRVVIWGSGSKGVAFLTTADLDRLVEYVIDINPHRHGNYMAKTGQEIVGPGFLRQYKPDVVLVMNPVYQQEIGAEIHRLGVKAEILTT